MAAEASDAKRQVYSVTDITRRIRVTLEDTFGSVWIEGELSNVRCPASGHMYFTIKDERAQISGAMFRSAQRSLKFEPKDGVQVVAFGEISVYERSGQYQIIVRKLEPGGQGALQAAFEALKLQLQEEGLFDPDRKQILPRLPQHVGVVTSATGAAIRDILKVIANRFPNLHIVLAPVRVQGAGAAEEIAAAIDLLNDRGGFDVLIVGRGGGSIEDLWCFNEEVVARAIHRSKIPVISAVGHEIDFTIADFVADARAATPSAAAEMVVERRDALEALLDQYARRLTAALREQLMEIRTRLVAAAGSYVFQEPRHLVDRHRRTVYECALRMNHAGGGAVREGQQRMDEILVRMQHAVTAAHRAGTEDVKRLQVQLRAMNPHAVLDRGYSVTTDPAGKVIREACEVQPGQRLLTRVAEGTIESEVTALGE